MNQNVIYQMHPIHGNIKCLLAISWIALFLQTSHLLFILLNGLYISYLEIIFNVLLTITLHVIAVLLSISNNLVSEKSYKFLKVSFILSIVNVGISLLSIGTVLCAFNYKLRGFLKTSPYIEALYSLQKFLIGISIFFVRGMELLPSLIFLCYKKLIFRNKGEILQNLPAKRGITDENVGPLLDEKNQV